MSTINKSASRVGRLKWRASGVEVELWLGTNSNTGDHILWQQIVAPVVRRPRRHTGWNITKVAQELNGALNEGEADWLQHDDRLLDALGRMTGILSLEEAGSGHS